MAHIAFRISTDAPHVTNLLVILIEIPHIRPMMKTELANNYMLCNSCFLYWKSNPAKISPKDSVKTLVSYTGNHSNIFDSEINSVIPSNGLQHSYKS